MGDEAGRVVLEEARDLAAAVGDHGLVALAYSSMGTIAGELFEFPRALDYLTQTVEYTTAHELEAAGGYARSWLALTYLYLGRWDEAEETARQVLHGHQIPSLSRIMATLALGKLAARRGSDDAGPLLDRALELALESDMLQRIAPVSAARAEHAWMAGEPERVREEASRILDLAIKKRHAWFAGELLFWLSMAEERVEPPDWIARPFALQIAGDWRAAAVEWRRLECPYEMARALARSRDPADLLEAQSAFERLGAEQALREVARRLREVGVRGVPRGPRQSTRENPAGLTRRQLEITRLLAEGLQNTEIASRLFLSPKTVDHHVSTILSKLGVRSRTEAVREAVRLGIVEDVAVLGSPQAVAVDGTKRS